jgi:hypothetical protein
MDKFLQTCGKLKKKESTFYHPKYGEGACQHKLIILIPSFDQNG